ncbi:unnamed protein product [Prunus armeniaca]
MERLVDCFTRRGREAQALTMVLQFAGCVIYQKTSSSTLAMSNGLPEQNNFTPSHDIRTESVLDTTKQFTTDEIFNSREALLNWSRVQGRKCGIVVVIKRSDGARKIITRRARVTLCCERGEHYIKKSTIDSDDEQPMNSKANLKGLNIGPGDEWKVEVVCGVHNHHSAEYLEGHSYAGRLRVIVTDREIALMNAIRNVFPSVRHLLCRWHINRCVMKACKGILKKDLTQQYNEKLPAAIRPFIMGAKDVKSDGNCGFRAISGLLGYGENSWRKSVESKREVAYRLDYFDDYLLEDRWMLIPEMGYLIANCYNVVLMHFSNAISLMFLPTESHPLPEYQRREISIGLVEKHFVQLYLQPHHPMPSVINRRLDISNLKAFDWYSPYRDRIDNWKELTGSFDVHLDVY